MPMQDNQSKGSGLLNRGSEQQPGVQPGASQQKQNAGGPPGGMKKPNVSAEKQQLYDIFVAQGTRVAVRQVDAVKKAINSGLDPKTAISDIMLGIIDKIESQGKQNGIDFDDNILVYGGGEILTNLMLMAGIDLQENEIQQIVGSVVGSYINKGLKSGKITQEQLAMIAQKAKGGQQGAVQPVESGRQQPQPPLMQPGGGQ